jgi:hypothetical protein
MGKEFEQQLSRRIMTEDGWFFFAGFVGNSNVKLSFTNQPKQNGELIPSVKNITPEKNLMMMVKWTTLNLTQLRNLILLKHKNFWKDWVTPSMVRNLSISNL